MNRPHLKRTGYPGIVPIRRKRWKIYPNRLKKSYIYIKSERIRGGLLLQLC